MFSSVGCTIHATDKGIIVVIHHNRWFFPGDWESTVLRSSHEFYKWFSELAVIRREQVQGEYTEYLESLQRRLNVAQEITSRIDKSLAALNGLQEDHSSVASKVIPLTIFYTCLRHCAR